MIYLTALIPCLVLGYLLWRADRRYDNAEAAWRQERSDLLQRIQAPERALVEDFEPESLVQYVPLDDDEAFMKNREELSGRS